ncbi:outer membrane protein [Sphingopyxis witflariensis]|uniref:Outer membrane protein beta-barrel domain-containing protein n=1 Tax=Sphingopyxis witflariensis TaxID=173675 RepID=A0A2D0AMY4_9SPHN|nr:porin family protein [Sphingopyxis witflariensis]OWQ95121.1 hypothetical protein CDQ91_14470 [Sphingopyxis witflariensis]
MFKYAIAAAVVAVSIAPAQAQDFPGLRVEANVGFDSTRGKLSYKDTAAPEDDFSVGESTSGVTYGGTIGYDAKMSDSIYLGFEVSADFADNKRCEEVFGDDAACFSLKRNLAAGVRIGTAVAKSTLFYVGAAYVNGKARVSYTDELDASNNISDSDARDGYRLSAGIEHRLSGNIFAKAEYRYSDYKDYKLADGTESLALGFSRHQGVVGVGVRF